MSAVSSGGSSAVRQCERTRRATRRGASGGDCGLRQSCSPPPPLPPRRRRSRAATRRRAAARGRGRGRAGSATTARCGAPRGPREGLHEQRHPGREEGGGVRAEGRCRLEEVVDKVVIEGRPAARPPPKVPRSKRARRRWREDGEDGGDDAQDDEDGVAPASAASWMEARGLRVAPERGVGCPGRSAARERTSASSRGRSSAIIPPRSPSALVRPRPSPREEGEACTRAARVGEAEEAEAAPSAALAPTALAAAAACAGAAAAAAPSRPSPPSSAARR